MAQVQFIVLYIYTKKTSLICHYVIKNPEFPHGEIIDLVQTALS